MSNAEPMTEEIFMGRHMVHCCDGGAESTLLPRVEAKGVVGVLGHLQFKFYDRSE